MDAYLSTEAYQTLAALSLISSESNSDGLLIGHKRGHRYFVEKIFPTLKGFFPSREKYFAMNKLFEEKILGFYSFVKDEKKNKKILTPFGHGKLFLQISLNKNKKMTVKSYVIDYENEFFLSPIHLKSNK
ncbi:MAG: hypothetical protein V3U91_05445 [Candidatus Aminicenantaceae bacterium]